MIQGKQRNLRVFEFEPCEEQELKEYIERNHILLRGFLILLSQDISDSLRDFLQENKLLFMESKLFASLKRNNHHNQQKIQSNTIDANKNENISQQIDANLPKSLFLNRIVRSGEDIQCDGNVVIYGRVNSGAKIYAKGNVQIYGEIDGIIECEGDFMIITKIGQGSVLFGGEFLNPNLFNGDKMVIFKDGKNHIIKEN